MHGINAADDIRRDEPALGYRFSTDAPRERGIAAGENRVARLSSQQRIWSVFAKMPGMTRRAGPPVHDDLVNRVFTAPAPNVVWLINVTEHADSQLNRRLVWGARDGGLVDLASRRGADRSGS